jgi:hypothetical protein
MLSLLSFEISLIVFRDKITYSCDQAINKNSQNNCGNLTGLDGTMRPLFLSAIKRFRAFKPYKENNNYGRIKL